MHAHPVVSTRPQVPRPRSAPAAPTTASALARLGRLFVLCAVSLVPAQVLEFFPAPAAPPSRPAPSPCVATPAPTPSPASTLRSPTPAGRGPAQGAPPGPGARRTGGGLPPVCRSKGCGTPRPPAAQGRHPAGHRAAHPPPLGPGHHHGGVRPPRRGGHAQRPRSARLRDVRASPAEQSPGAAAGDTPPLAPGLLLASWPWKDEGRGPEDFSKDSAPFKWSGRQDSNLRPLGPEPSALPG